MVRDDAKLIRLLKTAGGQIEGIIKMIEEGKYCIDISNQIMGGAQRASALLRAVLGGERIGGREDGRDRRRAR